MSVCIRSLKFSLLLVATVFVAGCENGGEQQGGPGADTTADPDTDPQSEDSTFTASVSEEQIEVAQGQRTELTLSLDRGEAFDQSVEVKFEAPAGLSVLPETATIEGSQSETTVMVQAEQTAEAKEHALTVTFEPTTGKAVEKVVTITVVQPEQ